MSVIRLRDAQAAETFGAMLAGMVQAGDVIALSGPLGAGKTSIARGLLSALGLVGEAPSPSFAIVQPYDPPEVRLPVMHVDLYRIDSPAEVEELGLEEARADALLMVEWPERLDDQYWADALWITLTIEPDGVRALTAQVPPGWKARWTLT